DLDNDGDLDLLINNLDQKISLFENNTSNHYLRIKLIGPEKNPMGIGTKISLKDTTRHFQTQELSPTRGFQSSMEPILHFGLESIKNEQTLTITWPDLKQEIKTIREFDRLLTIDYSNAIHQKQPISKGENKKFLDVTSSLNINFQHKENVYDDYLLEPLLPHKYSTLGPGLTVGDSNGDLLDDFYVGNARNTAGKLYQQTAMGSFKEIEGPWEDDKNFEDTGALFFDADSDGDQDLYVVSGGNQKGLPDASFQDRLYINTDGAYVNSHALPDMPSSGQIVKACDYDKDGDQDLFIGGRIESGRYPEPPRSYLLNNEGSKMGQVKFTDATHKVAEDLSRIGMVTEALWIDIDGDSWKDLVLAGEWMPITLFRNIKGELVEETGEWNLGQNIGWWYGLEALDVDNDGDLDLVAGNLGLNYKYSASPKKPFEVFLNDFDQNGKKDIVLGVHKEGRLLPLRGRECSSQQIPAIKAKYATYREFAAADLSDIYGASMLESSVHYQATTFAHYWLENSGEGQFIWHLLPNRSQFSPINTILPFDYDNDGYSDLLVIGTLYDSEVETPRADAGVGLVLRNKKGKGFEAIEPQLSKLYVTGNVKDANSITINGNKGFVFARNNDSLEIKLYQNSKNPEQQNEKQN
ncbi:MAG: FG-GAP-like repeat-containing protein, partial [Flavobacteriaceae bacterium]